MVLAVMLTINLYAQDTHPTVSTKGTIKIFFKMLLGEEEITVARFSTVFEMLSYNEAVYKSYKEGLSEEVIDLCAIEDEIDLNSKTIRSQIFLDIKNKLRPLIGKQDISNVFKMIASSEELFEGQYFEGSLGLRFPNGTLIYFTISDCCKIINIWVEEDNALVNLIKYSDEIIVFKRPGMIDDPDGYVNVREFTSVDSEVVGRISKNQIFYYSPIGSSNWYPVYRYDYQFNVKSGFIHKSRILEYKDFPEKYKEIVKKDRGGC